MRCQLFCGCSTHGQLSEGVAVHADVAQRIFWHIGSDLGTSVHHCRCNRALDLASDANDHASTLWRASTLTHNNGNGANEAANGVFSGGSALVAWLVHRTTHVLFVSPTIEDANVKEIGEGSRPCRCERLLCEVRLVC